MDASKIDWRAQSRGFPYFLRQEGGPDNPLGRVAFMFPNVHAVYLHDTPSRGLFQQAERAFSSGCIRIENPLKLAEVVLRDDPKWDQVGLERAAAKGQNRRINLPRKTTIMLLYLTAFPAQNGDVQFRRDVYGRAGAGRAGRPTAFSATQGLSDPRCIRHLSSSGRQAMANFALHNPRDCRRCANSGTRPVDRWHHGGRPRRQTRIMSHRRIPPIAQGAVECGSECDDPRPP